MKKRHKQIEENTRYTGEPKRLYDFMDEFAVHCPKCSKKAIVSVPHFLDYKKASVTCTCCHFSEKMNSRNAYVTKGKTTCVQCGEWIDWNDETKRKRPSYLNIICRHCKTINKISGDWSEIFVKYNASGITDPAFGLPLWYLKGFKSYEIWAYNAQHLVEIKSYVGAKLRERSTKHFKMTMVEKLPNFIKSAKNRVEILSTIEAMQKK